MSFFYFTNMKTLFIFFLSVQLYPLELKAVSEVETFFFNSFKNKINCDKSVVEYIEKTVPLINPSHIEKNIFFGHVSRFVEIVRPIFFKNHYKTEAEDVLKNKIKEESKNSFSINNGQKKLFVYINILGIFLIILLFLSLLYHNKLTARDLEIAKMKELELKRLNEYEQLEKSKINDELKAQKREMLNSLLFLRDINTEINKVLDKINKIAEKSVITKDDLHKLKEEIIYRNNKIKKKSDFNQKLANTHKKFFTELIQLHPDLTTTELKILAYLRVSMTTKEIADIQNVTIEAVRKTRYRVRKKMNLKSDESLEQYLLNIQ